MMWFKNLQLFRLPASWGLTKDELIKALTQHAFVSCTPSDMHRQGWEPPREKGELVHTVNRQFLLCLSSEKKLLPTCVINQVAKVRAAEMEEAQGFPPGKKATKELKERIADELLPRAFAIRSKTNVWIDPVNGWLAVDTFAPTKADEVIKLLLKSITALPAENLRVQCSPVAAMTEWLQSDDAPSCFTIDMDTEMRATGESKATVRYIRHALEAEDVRRHIAGGKQCTRLAMTWNDKISFVLTDSLAIKNIKPLNVLKEAESSTKNNDERFDCDMALMTAEYNMMLNDIVAALGGEARS